MAFATQSNDSFSCKRGSQHHSRHNNNNNINQISSILHDKHVQHFGCSTDLFFFSSAKLGLNFIVFGVNLIYWFLFKCVCVVREWQDKIRQYIFGASGVRDKQFNLQIVRNDESGTFSCLCVFFVSSFRVIVCAVFHLLLFGYVCILFRFFIRSLLSIFFFFVLFIVMWHM